MLISKRTVLFLSGLKIPVTIERSTNFTDVFVPFEQSNTWGQRLRLLFPNVWSSEKAFDAFVTFAHYQRQRFLKKIWAPGEIRCGVYAGLTKCVEAFGNRYLYDSHR